MSRIVFGGSLIGRAVDFDVAREMVEVLKGSRVRDIDTAHVYLNSEEIFGRLGAPAHFAISSKAPAMAPNAMSRESVLKGMENTLRLLGVEQIDIYYLHAPDPTTPIEETLGAIQELYEGGKFKRFGLSNFTPTEVEEVHTLCTSKSYVLPTVYQGNYNPVARHAETTLLPLLRKLHMSFYAYSPLAGGFLVKSAAQFTDDNPNANHSVRWNPSDRSGRLYRRLYKKPKLLEALAKWEDIATRAGVGKAAMAYRWVMYNSALKDGEDDATIIGATRVVQLQETLKATGDGPLDQAIVEEINAIWELVKDEAPIDNYVSA